MANRTGNYCAFYVKTPFNQNNLGANSTKDFVYYNLLQAWKAADPSFPFVDSHNKNYNVRDDSDWEKTLKPRLRERLNASKNIILFLSSITKDSRALHEEIEYGICNLGLPVIVIYPDYRVNADITLNGHIRQGVVDLWDNLPIFKNNMDKVPTIHIALDKAYIIKALNNPKFSVVTIGDPGRYFFNN
jgi:hypothetical protein